MKTHTKNILFTAGVVAASFLMVGLQPVSAAPLYAENFDKDPGYVGAKGPNDNNISSVAYGAEATKAPDVKAGQFGGTSQYLKDAVVIGSTAKGALALGSNDRIYDKGRNRTTMTFVDTSQAKIGQYTVTFDVSDLKATDDQTSLYFHLFEGRGTNRGVVEFQVTYQTKLPEKAPTAPEFKGIKGAKASKISVDNVIKENGKFTLDFRLEAAGKPGDFLALAWSQVKQGGNAVIPSMTIDNINISMKEVGVAGVAAAAVGAE